MQIERLTSIRPAPGSPPRRARAVAVPLPTPTQRLETWLLRLVMAATLAVAAIVAIASSARAETLTGDEIRALVTGRTIFLATPFGGELPLNYRRNGTVDGNGAAIGLGRFFAPRDTGRWFISGNRLCQQFQTWYNGERLCFTVVDLGNNRIRWIRDNGEQGIARVGN